MGKKLRLQWIVSALRCYAADLAAKADGMPGSHTKEELEELVELALEGRRRVKEQLKKMGSFEYYQTSFSYIDSETRGERYVGVPEEGGRDLISLDPLAQNAEL